MKEYQAKSPVLFLIFNRPDTTQAVFEQIRAVKPSKLYIAADGPRQDRPDEARLCEQALSIIEKVDWDCTVKTLIRQENIGCKHAVSSAIDWLFENEEEGIILEDDCLPAISFFYYCDTVLEKYRHESRVRHVSGCNLQFGKKWGDANIYFSNRTDIWGWATWKRVWKDYDKDFKQYEQKDIGPQFSKIFSDRFILETIKNVFKDMKAGKIDTWDYQLSFLNYLNNSLSVNPNVNLITNIGFRPDATHTVDPKGQSANIPLEEIEEITFPKFFLPEKGADYAIYTREYDLPKRWKKYNRIDKRLKRWIKKILKTSSAEL